MDPIYVYTVLDGENIIKWRDLETSTFPYVIRPINDTMAVVSISRYNCDRNLILKTLTSRFFNQDKYIMLDDGSIHFAQAQSLIITRIHDKDVIDKLSDKFAKIAKMLL